MRTVLPLIVLLVACKATDEPNKPAKTSERQEIVNDCDWQVYATEPLTYRSLPVPADAHEEVFGAEPAPYQVRYSWASNDPSTGAGFLWRTDVDTLASVVEYGLDGQLTERVEGFTFLYGAADPNTGPERIHELHLCDGLEPGRTYSYRVGGDGHWSDTFEFTTPQPPGSFDTFRIGFAGDSRGSYEVWGEVLAAMDGHGVDFYLFGGDMVDLGPFQDQWDDWFAASGDLLAQKALVPAHGNHEFFATAYFANFANPGNEQWFHHKYGNMVMLSLNDTVESPEDISDEQPQYIGDVLSGSDATWKFAYHHASPYSTNSNHHSNLNVREHWVPEYEKYGVQAVLNGHNHTYERSVPIKADAEVADGEGPIYIVSGGAGAPLYTGHDGDWWNVVANAVEHYMIIDISPAGAAFTAYDLSGNVIDEFVIPAP